MKQENSYTPEQIMEAIEFYDIIASVPPDERHLVTIAAESFVNGMQAKAMKAGAQGKEV